MYSGYAKENGGNKFSAKSVRSDTLSVKSHWYSKSRLNESIKRGFQRFCDGTSCHGFRELYYSKAWLWTVIWILILCVAFALSAYQIFQVIKQYIDQPTSTMIKPALEEDILYPPLRLCYPIWLYWVDWDKALSLGFRKDELVFAANYINTIFTSDTDFNITEAELRFGQNMAKNNLTHLSDFYKAIARPLSTSISAENRLIDYFDRVEIFLRYPGYMLCYTISEENLFKYFTDNRFVFENNDGQKVVSFQTKDMTYKNVNKFVSKLEYNRYMLRWIDAKSMYKTTNLDQAEFAEFAPPFVLYPNGYNSENVDLFTENDAYRVDLTAVSRTLESTSKNVCRQGVRSFISNRSCKVHCKAMRDQLCTCRSLDLSFLLKQDKHLDKLCLKGITRVVAMTSLNDTLLGQTEPNHTYSKQKCPGVDSDEMRNVAECENACVPACQLWTWTTTVATTTMSDVVRAFGQKSMTNVTLTYPTASKIMTMSEVELNSWESFLGNIGGLVGVWTGASVISIVQLLYLFCFEDTVMDAKVFKKLRLFPIRQRISVKGNVVKVKRTKESRGKIVATNVS